MKHLFLTGKIQIGKSTLLRRWLSQIHADVGGFFTKKAPERDGHVYVHMLHAGGEDSFCDDNILFDSRFRDIAEATRHFDEIGCRLLAASADADLIIMDEIGRMERDAHAFQQAVMETLDLGTPVLGVLREDQLRAMMFPEECPKETFALEIAMRSDVEVIEITQSNRDELARSLPDILLPFSC